jgi:hypothetical protein
MLILAVASAALIPFTPSGLRYMNFLCIVLACVWALILGVRSLLGRPDPPPTEALTGLLHPTAEHDLLSMLAPPPRRKPG